MNSNVGSHLLRKLAVTLCRRPDIHKDDTNCRARWNSNSRFQDRYCDMQLDWADINTASKLCVGQGPIVYKAKEDSGVSDE